METTLERRKLDLWAYRSTYLSETLYCRRRENAQRTLAWRSGLDFLPQKTVESASAPASKSRELERLQTPRSLWARHIRRMLDGSRTADFDIGRTRRSTHWPLHKSSERARGEL